jgi:hypothetical protein
MNRKQLTILLVLVVVLGIAGLLTYTKQNEARKVGDPSAGKKLLGDLPINDVLHLVIKQGSQELNLEKKNDLWVVRERNNYPANYSEISDFLIKAKDLKIVQSEQVGASQLPRLGLVAGEGSNAAVTLDLRGQGDKSLRALLLGKKHLRKPNRAAPSQFGEMDDQGFPDGRYVKVAAGSDAVAVISDPLTSIEPKPESWLSKDFLKVEKLRSAEVVFPVASNSWKLTRETESGEWKLADAKAGEPLDASKAAGISSAFSSPSFNDVVVDAKPEALGLDKPTTVTLETLDNFTYTIKAGQKTNDNYPLTVTVTAQLAKERTPGKDEKAEDKAKLDKEFKDKLAKLEEKLAQEKSYEKWVYLVSSWSLDSLLKERGQLLVEKKSDDKKDNKNGSISVPPADDKQDSDSK